MALIKVCDRCESDDAKTLKIEFPPEIWRGKVANGYGEKRRARGGCYQCGEPTEQHLCRKHADIRNAQARANRARIKRRQELVIERFQREKKYG